MNTCIIAEFQINATDWMKAEYEHNKLQERSVTCNAGHRDSYFNSTSITKVWFVMFGSVIHEFLQQMK